MLSCGRVLSCSAIFLRRCLRPLFVSCRCASAVCVLGCRAVCSLSSPPCAVLCCAVLVLFRCAVLFPVACVVGSWCRCLLLGVCWWLWLPGVVVWWCVLVGWLVGWLVWPSLGVFPVPGGVPVPCAVSCGALLPCGAMLWRPVFFFFFFSSPFWWRWFPVFPRWFSAPGRFWVVSVSVLCPCGAVLVCLRRCSLFGALLPSRGWLVFCVVACCVCVFAVGPGCPLLSPGGSWRLLVLCLGGVLWRVLGCCAAPCCCALCRLALRCCALCCFVSLRLVLPRAVLCPEALSVVLGPVASGAVFCLVPSRSVCFAVACRCVVLFAVVPCAVCALGCCVVRFLSSPPCAVLLCGPLSLGALLPCAVPRGAVLPCGAVVSCPAALLGLFLAWVCLYLLDKPPQFRKICSFLSFWLLKIKKGYTRPNTLACNKTMYAAVSYVPPVILDVLGLVLVRGVMERVHC